MKKISNITLIAFSIIYLNIETATAISIPVKIEDNIVFNPTIKPASLRGVIIPFAPVTPDYNAAIEEFKYASRSERKSRITEAKSLLKAYKKQKKNGDDVSTNTVLLGILCVILPPLAVYLHQGEVNNKFWISLLLTLLFWLPGIIYAFVVVFGGG